MKIMMLLHCILLLNPIIYNNIFEVILKDFMFGQNDVTTIFRLNRVESNYAHIKKST